MHSPDWPRYASHSPEIWKYLDKVCETFDLRKYMTFNTEVIGCYWNEEAGQWTVKLCQSSPGAAPREFEAKCDLLLHATGILNNFKYPDIEGLNKFKGKVVRKCFNLTAVIATSHQNRYCTVAQRLPERAMEGRIRGNYWLRRIFHPNPAEYATLCQAHRCLRSHRGLVHLNCGEQWRRRNLHGGRTKRIPE